MKIPHILQKHPIVTIIADLLSAGKTGSSDHAVKDVRIGLHWTAVHSQYLGLAATQPENSCCFAQDIRGSGHLHEKTAYELAEYLRSNRPLEASLGMAALNSLLSGDPKNMVELNARDLIIQRGIGKNVVLVGHFQFTEEIRKVARQLWVLELELNPGDTPAEEAPHILPQADVIALTGSTLLNSTFEDLSHHFPPEALVIMLGPSTPLSPVLFDYRIDVISGAMVSDPQAVLDQISQGSPLHKPQGLRRITLSRDRSIAIK